MVTIGRSGSELFEHGIYSLHPLYCACDGVEIVEQYGESRCTFLTRLSSCQAQLKLVEARCMFPRSP